MRGIHSLWAGGLLLVALARSAAAASQSFSPQADTTLFAEAAENNLGASDTLVVGSTGHGRPGRALLRFGIAGVLPAGAVISAARLEFSVTKAPAGGVASTIGIHRVLQPWGEGEGSGNLGRAAVAGEANWQVRSFPDVPWTVPGGEVGVDFGAASATVSVDAPKRYVVSSAGLLDDVRAWQTNAAAQLGWVLIGDRENEALTARRLGSRESTASGTRPVLIVEWSPGPVSGSGPVLEQGKVEDGRFRFEFLGEAGNLYQVQFRDDGMTASWKVLTNLVVKLVPIRVVVTDPTPVDAGTGMRFYRVADVGDVD